MELFFHNIVLGFLLLFLLFPSHEALDFSSEKALGTIDPQYDPKMFNRSFFPSDFIFGLAGSAYQIEGGWNVDGRGLSVWDNFTHTFPERIADRSNGDNAAKSYFLYKDDANILKEMNTDAYWFTIQWSRVLPNGRIDGGQGINQKGIEYYNNLINELLAKGLKPCVSIFVFDLPQALLTDYGNLLSDPKFRKDFYDYSNLLFHTFGDRVKIWNTITEPNSLIQLAYDSGSFPPNRCSAFMNNKCFGGNSGTEPYEVGHNLLLAHAEVVQLYRTQYKEKQKGKIGLELAGFWPYPYNSSKVEDQIATRRYIDFVFGLFMSPVTYGYYPKSVRDYVGNRLPEFTKEESALVNGSIDFLGFNYFGAFYIGNIEIPPVYAYPESHAYDIRVSITYTNSRLMLAGEKLGAPWQYSNPQGFYNYLVYIKDNYKDPLIYILENGASAIGVQNVLLPIAYQDHFRIRFHYQHLSFLKKAIDDGVKVKGYFGWSLYDYFEWVDGYTYGFGLVHVDYGRTYKRYPKLSALWYKNFLAS